MGHQSHSFPIMAHRKGRRDHARDFSIPWEMISPHERQAERNHDQTLKRLAERGGLAPCEAIAVLDDRRWKPMDDEEAHAELLRRLGEWEREHGPLPP